MATKTKIYDESLLGALRQTIVVPPTTTVEKEAAPRIRLIVIPDYTIP